MYRVLIFISLLALALAGEKPQHQSALQHQHFRNKNVEALSNQAKQRFKSKTARKTCADIKARDRSLGEGISRDLDDDTMCFDVNPDGSPILTTSEEDIQNWGFIKLLYRMSDKRARKGIRRYGAWVVSKLDGHLNGANPYGCQELKNRAFDNQRGPMSARNVAIRTGKALLEQNNIVTESCIDKIRAELAANGPAPKVELVNSDYCWSGTSEEWGVSGKECPKWCCGNVKDLFIYHGRYGPKGKCNCKSPCETDPDRDLGSKHTCDVLMATDMPRKDTICSRSTPSWLPAAEC